MPDRPHALVDRASNNIIHEGLASECEAIRERLVEADPDAANSLEVIGP